MTWWKSQPAGRRAKFVILMVVLALIVLAAVFGLGRILFAKGDAGSSAEGTAPVQQSEKESSDPGAGAKGTKAFGIEYDENGMAVMPVTTDPREAAAGAAAVAFSVDFSKLSRQEFVDEAIARMTHPSPDYIGAEGQIHTLVESAPFEETKRYYWAPERVLLAQTDAWATLDNPERYPWWELASGSFYDNMALLPDHFWKAHPEIVLGEDEIGEIDPDLLPRFKEATDMTPDTPGATLTHWWVMSEVENAQVGTAAASSKRPAHFAIWCDAPGDGGLCGVAYTLDTGFPAIWPRQ